MVDEMKLGTRTREVLQRMSDKKHTDEGTLVQAKGGGWWIGNEQTSGAVGNRLLGSCLITAQQGSSEEMRYFSINEEGERVLVDETYIPVIEQHIRTKGGPIA